MSAYLDSALWALGRGTGVVALLMFTVSLVLGIVTRSGREVPGVGRFGVAELHRTAALTGTALIALHIGTLLLDPLSQLRLVDFVVPFLGSYRPIWLGLGTLAVDLLLVVTVVSLLRDRVGPRVFRAVHWGTYALWPMALAHALGNGSDNGDAVAARPRWCLHRCGRGRSRLAVHRGVRRTRACPDPAVGGAMTTTSIRPLTGTQRLLGVQAQSWGEHMAMLGPVPQLTADQLVALVQEAGLTGRGGAGFPTARKIAGIAASRRTPVVVGNAMEGEALSHKDRTLLDRPPTSSSTVSRSWGRPSAADGSSSPPGSGSNPH